MTVTTWASRRSLVPELPPDGQAAVRGGRWGNFVDQVNIFLPVTALAPALPLLAGPHSTATTAAVIIMATLVGRPLGAMVFGQIADRIGRTRTTKVAIAGTACCTLGIALVPDYRVLGAATIALIIALRFVGGAFLAGEYTSAIPLAMEWSTPRRRGLVSGRIMSMAPWAQGTIAFVTLALLTALGPHAYGVWGWRCSFVAGGAASLVMLAYYSRRVADAPVFTRRTRAARQPSELAEVVLGRHAGAFWQVFGLMSGLWFATNMTVIVVTSRLPGLGLSAVQVALVMGGASVAQAVVMSLTGGVSTRTGRRRFFVVGGLVAAVGGPLLWCALFLRGTSPTVGTGAGTVLLALVGVALLQVVTVTQYGPVGAYLTESFPTSVRATAYGTAYSASIVVPALYPFYLPALVDRWGPVTPVVALLALGGVLVAVCGAAGPRLAPDDLDGAMSS